MNLENTDNKVKTKTSIIIPTDFRIKEVMESKGISQNELANRLNVTTSAIKKWFTAKSLTTSTLQQIAQALEVDILDLIVSKDNTKQGKGVICPHCGKPLEIHIS